MESNTNEREQFVKALLRVAAVFDREMTETVIAAYWECLKEHPIAEVLDALKWSLVMCDAFPTIKWLRVFIANPESQKRWAR